MDFSINARAEGRVVVPWEHRRYPNLTHQDSSGKPRPISSSNSSPNLPPKPVSKPCSTGPSSQTGPAETMSGKPGDALAHPTPPPGGFSPPFAALSHTKSPTTSHLTSRGLAPTLPSCLQLPLPRSTSVRAHTSTTTKATFSQTGVLF
jgi:hypothetical protein